jgi:hypothetical protein
MPDMGDRSEDAGRRLETPLDEPRYGDIRLGEAVHWRASLAGNLSEDETVARCEEVVLEVARMFARTDPGVIGVDELGNWSPVPHSVWKRAALADPNRTIPLVGRPDLTSDRTMSGFIEFVSGDPNTGKPDRRRLNGPQLTKWYCRRYLGPLLLAAMRNERRIASSVVEGLETSLSDPDHTGFRRVEVAPAAALERPVLVECLARHNPPVMVPIGNQDYQFEVDPYGRHVVTVEREDHLAMFLADGRAQTYRAALPEPDDYYIQSKSHGEVPLLQMAPRDHAPATDSGFDDSLPPLCGAEEVRQVRAQSAWL